MVITNKKGIELTFETIVVFILMLVVLIILIFFIINHYSGNWENIFKIGNETISNID